MPVWMVCLWISSSSKQKQMRLLKWSNVTLLLVNNLYPGISQRERHHKVLNLGTSIMPLFSGHPTFSGESGSAGTWCSVSIMVASLSKGHWRRGRCSLCGSRCNWLHLALSCFGVTWAKTGQTLATIAAERGLAVRPLWTVSQPSASFLPKEHMR